MSDNIIKFKIPEPEDFSYMVTDDNEIIGVAGKNIEMRFFPDDDGFSFDGNYITREELTAFVLISGLWEDVQDKE